MRHRVVAANVSAFALGLEQDIIVLAVEVRNLDVVAVDLNSQRRPAISGILSLPVCVEIQSPGGVEGLGSQLVVDVEVLHVRVLALVLNLDAGALVEGHGDVAVQGGLASILLVLPGHNRYGEGKGLEVGGHGVSDAEEVPQRGQHARHIRVIPVNLEHDLAVEVLVVELIARPQGARSLEGG